MTALLDRVERAGLLSRNTNPDDRRSLLIRATPAGQQAVDWIYAEFDSALGRVIADSGERGTDAATLGIVLGLLGEALSVRVNTAAAAPRTSSLPSPPRPGPRPI
jgi:DNA-binding MarR family transcriptional regulator